MRQAVPYLDVGVRLSVGQHIRSEHRIPCRTLLCTNQMVPCRPCPLQGSSLRAPRQLSGDIFVKSANLVFVVVQMSRRRFFLDMARNLMLDEETCAVHRSLRLQPKQTCWPTNTTVLHFSQSYVWLRVARLPLDVGCASLRHWLGRRG